MGFVNECILLEGVFDLKTLLTLPPTPRWADCRASELSIKLPRTLMYATDFDFIHPIPVHLSLGT